MRFLMMSLLYAEILAVSFSLHAEELLGGRVSITLHGIVKDRGGAVISGARLIFGGTTLLSRKDGSFSLVENFVTVGGGHQIYTYPYTVEKEGYVSVSDSVILDTYQRGTLIVVHDMGTITLIGEATDLHRACFSIPVENTRKVSEAVYSVSGRMVSPVIGKLARSSAFQMVIRRNGSNQYNITGLQKHIVKQ